MRDKLNIDDNEIYNASVSGGEDDGARTPRRSWIGVMDKVEADLQEPEKPEDAEEPPVEEPAEPEAAAEEAVEESTEEPQRKWARPFRKREKAAEPTELPPGSEEMWQKAQEKARAAKAAKKAAVKAAMGAEAAEAAEETAPEPEVVPLEEYQKLEARVAVLTRDCESLKRRHVSEMEEHRMNANLNLAKVMLPIFDDFDKALAYSRANGMDTVDAAGMANIRKKLLGALEAEGLVAIEPLGQPFDANEHQAIELVETDGDSDMVVRVYQPGYKMNGRVIRPAVVAVSK